jgi:two-component system response regulator
MRSLKVLHIEDREDDAVLFSRACEAAGLPARFCRVKDGCEAVSYLTGAGEFTDRSRYPLPDLIVLDLQMPGMDGFDFMKWLRLESALGPLPVLVFTVSDSAEDKARALAEGAAGYFTKPQDFETLVKLAESFRQFSGDGEDKIKEVT